MWTGENDYNVDFPCVILHIVNMSMLRVTKSSFSSQLQMLRRLKKLSLRELSAALDGVVSHEMLSRYEKGTAEPREEVRAALCELLGIQDTAAYAPLLSLEEVKFRRSRHELPLKEWEAAKALAMERCNRYLELEALTGRSVPWSSPFTRAELRKLNRRIGETEEKTALMEDMAEELRKRWQLGSGPLPCLSILLERKGILICEIPFSDKRLDAFSIVHKGKPVICIADWLNQNPARKRMTLAHELGHILFPEVDADLPSDKEYCIMRFAGALLVPRDEVISALGRELRNELPLYLLQELKQYFGISIMGLIARAMQLNIIEWEQYRDYCNRFYKRLFALPADRQLSDVEPGAPYEIPDISPRLHTLLGFAVSTGLLKAEIAVQLFGFKLDMQRYESVL